MKVPYLDLSVNDKNLKKDLLAAVDQVLSHGRVVLGPEIPEFENLIAEMCDPVIVMAEGSVLFEGTPDEVMKNEKVIESYLGRANTK